MFAQEISYTHVHAQRNVFSQKRNIEEWKNDTTAGWHDGRVETFRMNAPLKGYPHHIDTVNLTERSARQNNICSRSFMLQ